MIHLKYYKFDKNLFIYYNLKMKSNFSFNDVNDALFNASKAGILELIKLMPGTGVFIESYKGY